MFFSRFGSLALILLCSAPSGPNEDPQKAENECSSTQFTDLTQEPLKQRLAAAQKFVPLGQPDVEFISHGKKISRQTFLVLDAKNRWIQVATECTGTCLGGNEGCGVSGCDADGNKCTQIQCTGGQPCASSCSKISTQ